MTMLDGDDEQDQIRLLAWSGIFANYDYQEIEQATIECMRICKFEPKPADILDALKALKRKSLPNVKELWDRYLEYLSYEPKDRTKEQMRRLEAFVLPTGTRIPAKDIVETVVAQTAYEQIQDKYNALPKIIRHYFVDKQGADRLKQRETTQMAISIARSEFKKWYEQAIDNLYSTTQSNPKIQSKAENEVIEQLSASKGQHSKQLPSIPNKANFDPSRLGYKDDTFDD